VVRRDHDLLVFFAAATLLAWLRYWSPTALPVRRGVLSVALVSKESAVAIVLDGLVGPDPRRV
jgi:hypothetical protein